MEFKMGVSCEVFIEKMKTCCNLPKWAVMAVTSLLYVTIVSGTAVAIVFILSKQALEVQGRIDKRMIDINAARC